MLLNKLPTKGEKMLYFFGFGEGHLSSEIYKKAGKMGACLVNYTDAQCNCGYGCKPYTCKKSERHWFEIDNMGFPHDKEKAKEILEALGLQDTHRYIIMGES